MPKDHGDTFPSDIDDVKPSAPTIDYSEVTTRRQGARDPRITPQDTGFNENSNIPETFSPVRYSWEGTVIE